MLKKYFINEQSITWESILKNEIKKKYFYFLIKFLENEYKKYNIFPKKNQILKALELKFKNIKVVILGQDPYYTKNLANGLAFSTPYNEKKPPTLKNIILELKYNIKTNVNLNHFTLEKWPTEGILLLNSILTVRENKPLSHSNIGWEIFTNYIIKAINKYHENVVFLLWGNYAQSKEILIDKTKNYIIKTSHPSPYSARFGFFGSKCFTKTNDYLKKTQQKEINWVV